MELKDEAELEIDDSEVRVVRRESQTGPDKIDVNVYDYPDDKLRNYSQFNFRVDQDATGNAATYIGKGDQPSPTVVALRALHEYGFECTNFTMREVEEAWDANEGIEAVLQLTPVIAGALDDDPTAKHLAKVGGRYFQHLHGWMENADKQEGVESVTEFLDKIGEQDVAATIQENEGAGWDMEMELAETIMNTLISHKHDIDFEKDFTEGDIDDW